VLLIARTVDTPARAHRVGSKIHGNLFAMISLGRSLLLRTEHMRVLARNNWAGTSSPIEIVSATLRRPL
jgi:hypothetical protein